MELESLHDGKLSWEAMMGYFGRDLAQMFEKFMANVWRVQRSLAGRYVFFYSMLQYFRICDISVDFRDFLVGLSTTSEVLHSKPLFVCIEGYCFISNL